MSETYTLHAYGRKGNLYDGEPLPTRERYETDRVLLRLELEEDGARNAYSRRSFAYGYLRAMEQAAGWKLIDAATAYDGNGGIVALRWEQEKR